LKSKQAHPFSYYLGGEECFEANPLLKKLRKICPLFLGRTFPKIHGDELRHHKLVKRLGCRKKLPLLHFVKLVRKK
jgi:hypothetical protein